jgi:triphosphoribosyl-dephospho-CoA synthase|tara:strand:+ start:324 stop:1202 length:879 start_codon:yes stop_codon:yes gene_type:complete
MTHQPHFFIDKDKHSLDDLKSAYLFSCKKDIELIKPGNVNLLSSHKDTKAQDYLDSAILSSKELFNQNYSLGKRILESVNVTRSQVNVNTNLGIILLCAPVIQSYIDFNNLDLREGIKKTLSTTSIKDTHDLCAAINISSPGGLGDSDMYDTASYPNASIKQIMDYSQEYDRISYQYSHNFSDIFDFIIPKLEFLNQRYESLDISLSLLFIEILAKIPDSHISRKFGDKIAKKTSNNAHDLLKILDREHDPDYLAKALNNLDYEYKKKGINPGTTADLLVASLMIYKISGNN